MRMSKHMLITATIVAILLGWVSIPQARAAELTVTRTDDPSPGACISDDCSLREAVISANNRGGPDTILLSSQVYSLTIAVPSSGDFSFAQVGDLDVHDDLTIEGPTEGSTRATIDANGATIGDRVFEIHGADTDVTMRRLRVTDGRAHPTGPDNNGDGRPDFAYGGAIRIAAGAALSASDIVLDRNTTESIGQGGAVFNAGDLSLVRARISHNDATEGFSGGIQTEPGATTSLRDTEVHSNEADFGGGLSVFGGTIIERSAIYLNRATLGGGIRAAGGSSFTGLTNVTLAHNETTQGGSAIQARNGPGFTLNNVTIAHNTADSDGDGAGNAAVSLRRDNVSTSMEFRNTILAANEDGSPGSGDVPDCEVAGGATIMLAGYDLVGNRAGCNLASPIGAEGNQIGTSTNPIDPRLEIGINKNGGPTSTLALLAGSPAINTGGPTTPGAGPNPCFPSDQRGAPRVDCDIGAYERVLCRSKPVNRVGTPGADEMIGSAEDEVFLSLGGADTIKAGGGDDRVCAGGGNDTVFGAGGDDGVLGGRGADDLRGQGGNDIIRAGPGRDALNGGKGRDRLYGQDGNDSLNTRDGVEGNDLANGGSGSDTCRTDPKDRRVSC